MRPNDPNLQNSDIFSSAQVLGKLRDNFSMASEIPADLQTTLLRLKSGYHDNENPFASAHEDDPEGDEKTEERRRKKSMRMAHAAMRFETFSHNGYDLNFNQFMHGMEGAIEHVDDELAQTEKEAAATIQEAAAIKEEVTVDEDDILRAPNGNVIDDEFEYQRVMRSLGPDAQLKGSLMKEETTVVDGVLVEAANVDEAKLALEEAAKLEEEAAKLREEAAELETKAAELDAYQAKIAAGEMSPDDLPEEYKDMVIAEHIESEQNLSTEPAPVEVAQPLPVMEQAQQFIVSVTPGLKPEPTF